jgi:hypothetical protein
MKVQIASEALGIIEIELQQDGKADESIRRAVFLHDAEDAVKQSLKAAMAAVLAGDEEATFAVRVLK